MAAGGSLTFGNEYIAPIDMALYFTRDIEVLIRRSFTVFFILLYLEKDYRHGLHIPFNYLLCHRAKMQTYYGLPSVKLHVMFLQLLKPSVIICARLRNDSKIDVLHQKDRKGLLNWIENPINNNIQKHFGN